ncbi:MAG TPA: hypothetical protein PKI32_06255, partial [Opitutales bacterium]|nr:hypothetical protein [Opitutales bacterium]
DDGADETVIEGYCDADSPLGTNSVRCCYLSNGAWIRGFTLRNGSSVQVNSYDERGGALAGSGAAIECVFSSDNRAVRGASVASATLIRCRVTAGGEGLYFGDYYSDSSGYLVDCVFSGGAIAYTMATVLNTTFGNGSELRAMQDGANMAYNSIINFSSMYRKYSNCAFRLDRAGYEANIADGDCRFGVADALDANDRPVIGATNLIDLGKNDYYDTYFPAQWVRFKDGRDVSGGMRKVGERIDVGAGEFDWTVTASPELEVSISAGSVEGTWDVAISRRETSDNRCTGFVYGNETVVFGEHPVGFTWSRTVPEYPLASTLSPLVNLALYVDPLTGDDTNAGYHPTLAYATIKAAMSNIAARGTIHCAEGTYSPANGNVSFDGSASNVVCFTKDYVTLVADTGAEKTFIEGVYSAASNAVRGVSMKNAAHAIVFGFTIRNCGMQTAYNADGSAADLTELYAAGVYGGTAVDCVVSNCWSGSRGGAGYNAKFVRCRIGKGCKGDRTSLDPGGYLCDFYNCVIESQTYGDGHKAVACTFLGCGPRGVMASGRTAVYDSFVALTPGYAVYSNCVVCESAETSDVDGGGTVFNARAADYVFEPDTFRPVAGSPLIDAASQADLDALLPDVERSVDYAGGQRTYNGAPDIGAGEYDRRLDFAKRLVRSGLSVDVATPTVELGAEAGLTMKGGDVLELRWQLLLAGDCSFRVACADGCAAVVSVDGLVLTPGADGVYSFDGTVGEHVVSVTCSGTGIATVDAFTFPRRGSVLMFK